jgi:hypothetical protein
LKYSLYVRVDILLPLGRHMHDRITSVHKDISMISPLFRIWTFDCVVVPTVWYFLIVPFINLAWAIYFR